MSQKVYVAYKNKQGQTQWVKGPAFYNNDGKIALFFTPFTCSVGFLTSAFPSDMNFVGLMLEAQDWLDLEHGSKQSSGVADASALGQVLQGIYDKQ